jgi:hypothetical protein
VSGLNIKPGNDEGETVPTIASIRTATASVQSAILVSPDGAAYHGSPIDRKRNARKGGIHHGHGS